MTARAWMLALVVALALGGAGCGNRIAEANAAMDAANAAISQANALDVEAAAAVEELLALSPDDAEKAAGITERIEAKLDEKDAAVAVAKSELEKILAMDVPEDNKTYVSMQLEIVELPAQADDVVREIATGFEEMFTGANDGSLNEAGVEAKAAEIDKLVEDSEQLTTKIEEKSAEADAFFEQKQLGN